MPELLLELFSEEIPARMQRRAAEHLKKAVTNALVDAGLVYEGAKAFVTPRRLALTYQSVWAGAPDEVPSRLTFEIASNGPDITQLTVIHETEPGKGSTIAEVAAGWPYIISALKTLLETGEPMESYG